VRGPLRFSLCYCCEQLVAEAGDSSGNRRKGNVLHWKPSPNKDTEDTTVDTSVCVCNSVL
jgi:hypothetical protein